MREKLDDLRFSLAGRYTIGRELGRGGMAVVYLAEDLLHHRPVALKVIKPEIVRALGSDRFLREIALTGNLDHPNILPLLDSGDVDGTLFYVMPYVDGESLRDRLDRDGRLALDEALRITREVAEALGYFHGRGIIHRDIKPENILLSGGHARVGDFGIARAMVKPHETTMTESGVALGTPLYMSPEQSVGVKDLDGRSDQYALACVVFEMLAGEPPYTGATTQVILAKRLSEPIPRVRTLRAAVPHRIEQVLTRALSTAAADRYPSTAAFADALEGQGALARGQRWLRDVAGELRRTIESR